MEKKLLIYSNIILYPLDVVENYLTYLESLAIRESNIDFLFFIQYSELVINNEELKKKINLLKSNPCFFFFNADLENYKNPFILIQSNCVSMDLDYIIFLSPYSIFDDNVLISELINRPEFIPNKIKLIQQRIFTDIEGFLFYSFDDQNNFKELNKDPLLLETMINPFLGLVMDFEKVDEIAEHVKNKGFMGPTIEGDKNFLMHFFRKQFPIDNYPDIRYEDGNHCVIQCLKENLSTTEENIIFPMYQITQMIFIKYLIDFNKNNNLDDLTDDDVISDENQALLKSYLNMLFGNIDNFGKNIIEYILLKEKFDPIYKSFFEKYKIGKCNLLLDECLYPYTHLPWIL